MNRDQVMQNHKWGKATTVYSVTDEQDANIWQYPTHNNSHIKQDYPNREAQS